MVYLVRHNASETRSPRAHGEALPMNDPSCPIDGPGARLAAGLKPGTETHAWAPADLGVSTALLVRNRWPARYAALGQANTEV
jgi:hypothetical protein